MNKNMFYLFVIAQVVILFVLVGQYYFIDSYGKSFKVYIDESHNYSLFSQHTDIYVDYEIMEVKRKDWGIDEKSIYNDLVYVKLEKNETGVFEVTDVADHRLQAQNDEQVVLKATYIYDYAGKFHVDYRIQHELNIEQFVDVDRNKQMVAEFKLAPWGQIKLVGIENAPE